MSELHYITPQGAARLREELVRLRSVDRPKIVQEVADAAAQGDRSENAEYIYGKRKLREIDRRMHFLIKRLDVVTVVDPTQHLKAVVAPDRIYFGAWVDYTEELVSGESEIRDRRVQLVGEDETNSNAGHISWRSPVGRALLGKRLGQTFVVKTPRGEVEIEIRGINYAAAPTQSITNAGEGNPT